MNKLRKIIGHDGNITFYNKEYNDTYHSVTVPALEEARVKYVEPAELKSGDKVLDFCFGLGYNTLQAIHLVKNLEIIAIEIDKDILKEILNIEVPQEYKESYKIIQEEVLNSLNNRENGQLRIIIGDGREKTKNFSDNYFDAILFDPFSPKKHQELWSLEIFKEMFRIIAPNGRLTTYSCATWVRDNMKEAGFKVIDGPSFGRKAASTIAVKE